MYHELAYPKWLYRQLKLYFHMNIVTQIDVKPMQNGKIVHCVLKLKIHSKLWKCNVLNLLIHMVIVGITSFSSLDEFESKFIGGRMSGLLWTKLEHMVILKIDKTLTMFFDLFHVSSCFYNLNIIDVQWWSYYNGP